VYKSIALSFNYKDICFVALPLIKLYRFGKVIICILTKLILNSGELIKETYILIIYKDRGIKELCKAC